MALVTAYDRYIPRTNPHTGRVELLCADCTDGAKGAVWTAPDSHAVRLSALMSRADEHERDHHPTGRRDWEYYGGCDDDDPEDDTPAMPGGRAVTVTTIAEIEELPSGTVLVDATGLAWQKIGGDAFWRVGSTVEADTAHLSRHCGPLRAVYIPADDEIGA